MKNASKLITIALTIIAISFTACDKKGSDDAIAIPGNKPYVGPTTNANVKSMLIGSWQLESIDGQPFSGSYCLDFDNNNTFEATYYEYPNSYQTEGTWILINHDSQISFQFYDGDDDIMNIITISSNDLKLSDVVDQSLLDFKKTN